MDIKDFLAKIPELVSGLDEDYALDRARFQGSIEGVVLNILDSIDGYLIEVQETMDMPAVPKRLGTFKDKPSDYKSIELEPYLLVSHMLQAEVKDYMDQAIEGWNEIAPELEGDLRSLEKLMKTIRHKGFKIEPGDDEQTFRQNNVRRLPEITQAHINGAVIGAQKLGHIKEKYVALRDKINYIKETLTTAEKYAKELKQDLLLIRQLQHDPSITLSPEDVDNHLIALLNGEINRSRLNKMLHPKPKSSSSLPRVNNTIETRLGEQTTRNVRVYDQSELSFLEQRGIKSAHAKEVLDSQSYEDVKEFMKAFEAVFQRKNVDVKEAHHVYQMFPQILRFKRGERINYLTLVEEELFDLHDPSRVSGILPRHNPEIYASIKSLEAYIASKRSHVTKINIIGLDIITSESDRDLLRKQLEITPFSGEHLKKYMSGPLKGVKVFMYEKYSAIAGEGHYRKAKFGKRRAVFKVENTGNGSYDITVIKYFENHSGYSEFFYKSR